MSSAFIYVRVSDDRQADGTSLQTQEDICRGFCETRGLSVAKVYRDAGESAKTANRPQFQAMLAATKTAKVSAVVFYKFNRFARNQEDHVASAVLLRSRGVNILSATEPIEKSAYGRAVEGLLSVFNQLENDIRGENTMRGMKARLSSGRWQWKAPLGYQSGGDGRPSLVIDEQTGPLLKDLFEMIASGTLKKEMALKLISARGLRGQHGAMLTWNTLNKLLRNTLYYGWIEKPVWGVSKQGDFEPLISGETFKRVQDVLDGKSHPVPHLRSNPDFPLRGTIRCALCDRL